jgi:hypothetical protein
MGDDGGAGDVGSDASVPLGSTTPPPTEEDVLSSSADTVWWEVSSACGTGDGDLTSGGEHGGESSSEAETGDGRGSSSETVLLLSLSAFLLPTPLTAPTMPPPLLISFFCVETATGTAPAAATAAATAAITSSEEALAALPVATVTSTTGWNIMLLSDFVSIDDEVCHEMRKERKQLTIPGEKGRKEGGGGRKGGQRRAEPGPGDEIRWAF